MSIKNKSDPFPKGTSITIYSNGAGKPTGVIVFPKNKFMLRDKFENAFKGRGFETSINEGSRPAVFVNVKIIRKGQFGIK